MAEDTSLSRLESVETGTWWQRDVGWAQTIPALTISLQ